MTTEWRKRLLAPLLAVWVMALFFSAWPERLVPTRLASIQQSVHRSMKMASVVGGLPLFTGHGRNRPIRIINNCLQVIGVSSAGERTEIYSTWPACRTPRVRIVDSPLGRSLNRAVRAAIGRASFHGEPVRESAILQQVSQYFCTQAPMDGHDLQALYLVHQIRTLRLETNETNTSRQIIQFRDCQAGTNAPEEWPELSLGTDGDAVLSGGRP